MSIPLIIGCGVLLLTLAALFFIALCRVGARADEVTRDALRDGQGDEDFDWSWPPSTTCTSGDDPAAYRSAATSRPNPPAESLVQAKLPRAEARADGHEMGPAGVDRSEGMAAPSQPRDSRPTRHGQPGSAL